MIRSKVLGLLSLAFVTGSYAQSPKIDFPAASPACTLTQRVGLTDVQIAYSRPGAKGRMVFGGIAPYGVVWRTGANTVTKVTFSTDVTLNGTAVPAGTYGLLTIPGENEWTIILSKNSKQWGAFSYDSKDDQVRFKAQPSALASPVETFTIEWSQIRDESADLDLSWGTVRVPLHMGVEVASKVVPQIDAAMASDGKKSAGLYFASATFYFDHNLDLTKALGWLDAGLAQKPKSDFELLCLKAKILAKQGDKAGAIAAATQSRDIAMKQNGADSFVRMDNDIIESLR